MSHPGAESTRMERVVVITGPTSSGKTTLAEKLLGDSLPHLAERLDVERFEGWAYASASKLRKYGVPVTDRLVLHYDFMRPLKQKAESYALDPALQFLAGADHVSIITIWTPPPRLTDQFWQNELLSAKHEDRVRLNARILQLYQDPAEVLALYRSWFTFTDAYFANARPHLVVEFDHRLRVLSRHEWEEVVRVYE